MKLKEFLKNREWKKWDKSQWAILILTGILLMILAIPVEDKKQEKQKEENPVKNAAETVTAEGDYARELEEKLERALSKIEGAGRVEVMITLEDSGESVVEKDDTKESTDLTEKDDTGGSRTETSIQTAESTVYREEDNDKEPFVGKEKTPKIAGVLVVAEGGENTAVKQNISEAVMALFQIDVNRIKVVKMNIQEEEY